MFKNLTLEGKLSFAFGGVILLFAAIALVSYLDLDKTWVLGLSVFGILAGMTTLFLFTKHIKGLISSITDETQKLIEEAVQGNLCARGNPEKVNFEFSPIILGMNKLLDAIIAPLNMTSEYIVRISKGDIPEKITTEYKGDFEILKNSVNGCIDSINTLIESEKTILSEIVSGNLNARVDASKLEGDFSTISEAMNMILDSVIHPLKMAANFIGQLALGQTPAKITEEFKGEFNQLKENCNKCIDSISILVDEVGVVINGAKEGQLSKRANADRTTGVYRKLLRGINDTLNSLISPLNVAAEYIDRIAKGDIPPKIIDTYQGDFNEIKNNLNNCIDALNFLESELLVTIQLQKEGDIDARCNPTKLQGSYSKILEGTNQALDAISLPMVETINIINSYANGDFSHAMKELPGKQIVFTNMLNSIRKNLISLIKELQNLINEAKAGNLKERGNFLQFNGDYAGIIKGVNEMLDTILIPIDEANRVLNLIKGGNLREKVETECHGDHKKLKDAVNGVHKWFTELIKFFNNISKGDLNAEIEKASSEDQIHEWLMLMKNNISNLVSDVNMLTKSAIEGRLSNRADAYKHQGEFRKIVEGINDTLDAVINPLNVAAEYIDRISKGDVPPKISDNYNGDFNELKNNLNECIEAIHSLVMDTNMLAEAAVSGSLSKRADAYKHHGDFRKIIEGINNTLDALLNPINEAMGCLKEMADGNLAIKMAGTYEGDHVIIKNNLNKALDSINGILDEVSIATEQVVEGSHQIADSSQSLSQGSTEQASSIEEITSSMTQLSAQIKINAENANHATQLAFETRKAAESGNSQMQDMLNSMYAINDASQNISKIINVIDEIAFQTNLLALNAAVEAARAGRQGKGFAVVAEEVRNLAARSAKAARETADLIETSIRKTGIGAGIANKTAESLSGIVTMINKVNSLIEGISSASSDQAQGIAQINQALLQVDKVTQHNTANSEESASAAEELSGQAVNLQAMLHKFKLNSQRLLNTREISPNKRIQAGNPHMGKFIKESYLKPYETKIANPTDIIDLDDLEFGKY